MAFRDTQLTCATCGKTFIWLVEEQRELDEAGRAVVAPEFCREHRPPAALEPFGRVKWFDATKGFGFLIEPTGEELFFHRTGLAPGVAPQFNDGDPVTYDVQVGTKGPQAVNVAPYREDA